MPDKKTAEDKFADLVGALVTAAQRADLAAVREAAQQLVDVIDAPEEEEPKEPKEPSFSERFSRALDEKAKESSS